jgi:hypothetical protein
MNADEYKENLIASAKHIFDDFPTDKGAENTRYVKNSIKEHIKSLQENESAIPEMKGYGVNSLLSIVKSGNNGLRKIQDGESDLSKKKSY